MSPVASRERYLEALDIPAYLYESARPSTTSRRIKTRCLVLESREQDSFCQSGEVQSLLFKMLSAINLSADEVVLRNIQAAELNPVLREYEPTTVLLMDKELSSDIDRHFSTHHPSMVLADAKLKRDAWEVLKQLESCLS